MIARRIFFGVWSSFEKSGKLEPREPILRSWVTTPALYVIIYSATSSLVCFKNKNILFCHEKRSSLLQRQRCENLQRHE
jgi:hypothetical protein